MISTLTYLFRQIFEIDEVQSKGLKRKAYMSETPSLYDTSLHFAMQVHKHQTRKGKDTPYIVHCIDVAGLLASVYDDEELVAAGLLHDTVEDCVPYGSVTIPLLIAITGSSRVGRMVGDVTEQNKSLPWKERKRLAIEHIAVMEEDSVLLKTADIVSNLSELVRDCQEGNVEHVFTRFSASKALSVESYQRRLDALILRWAANPLLAQLGEKVEELHRVARV
ncbi:hypothetical protein C5B42_00730 [Candidatus Cerribacteria bacterium 'Amazon FNV 2010 28 9']|uniref:HD/PDEase domain-containing protein n=1 Tax=Candidatus Cerribacteria bacterium 'Amazon FNV 2010 28 9' TaxID=2081795 RepID=A0A317JRE5_9BACT|nr:MAG: hypothetical protein C5B42_00730 [Candidatus Cerribacteria bacterium 'Amazon FNV 2010 28 9']